MVSRYFTSDGDNTKFVFGNEGVLESYSRTWYNDSYLPVPGPRPNEERRIAGSKRVERYQLEHGHRKGSGKGQLLQSITAHPALSTRSFEELRVECYAQTFITQGGPPPPVTPGSVIPPLFNVCFDETDDVLPNEITMAV